MKLISLKKRSDFICVCNTGFEVFQPTFILKFLPTNDNRKAVGYLISKKSGNAVVRNKIKRRLRHAVRQSAENFIFSGMYVIISRKQLQFVKFDILEKSLQHALSDLQQLITQVKQQD